MTGFELRNMRERTGVSRHYVESWLGMGFAGLAHVEYGRDTVSDELVEGYQLAIENVRANSVPDYVEPWIMWNAPRFTEKWVDAQ